MSDDCIQEIVCSAVLGMQVQLGRASVCFVSDVNKLEKFLNRCKRLDYRNQRTEQLDKTDESLFQTVTPAVIMYCITSCRLLKTKHTNLGLDLTVSP